MVVVKPPVGGVGTVAAVVCPVAAVVRADVVGAVVVAVEVVVAVVVVAVVVVAVDVCGEQPTVATGWQSPVKRLKSLSSGHALAWVTMALPAMQLT
jgi:hypothetical protein